ncbi:hypothetical protein ZYGR_0E01120 [Zygosaccharomyces rouxii]|uniref:ZYRO0B02464p n=2 Tax=Zygosaccharomyces rouxii TaxID=4956 RepID=C5DQR8_ZYGRC|nr:uncharacterized protein ZYRO0B02464g [Zygosaccharomyces rouxii]KAH9200321.1 hypothetical protein LQ764DRAFT_210106 [Zygosaccharomyces rouxii]GAV47097.1 hypothetical protein ZYGR_0E01120 [Zygosaccharomyces rouxii]CAR26129.1 ZYRO0B02464p [Zygosaccharomyces rouxii]
MNPLLSPEMLSSEATMVYSTTYNSNLQTTNNFTVSSSESQGFAWNQDLFASQYQQMCKVVYDGHEDTLDGLMEYIRRHSGSSNNAGGNTAAFKYNEDGDEALTDCENNEEEDAEFEPTRLSEWRFFHPKVCEELNRPRRISERSLSFVSDSKNGSFNRCDTAVIEVDSDTPENNHLKWLLTAGK